MCQVFTCLRNWLFFTMITDDAYNSATKLQLLDYSQVYILPVSRTFPRIMSKHLTLLITDLESYSTIVGSNIIIGNRETRQSQSSRSLAILYVPVYNCVFSLSLNRLTRYHRREGTNNAVFDMHRINTCDELSYKNQMTGLLIF